MDNFDDFGFGNKPKKETKNDTRNYEEFKDVITNLTSDLERVLEPYKDKVMFEFRSLSKNNDAWKKEHNGEDCQPFLEKQWALAAPFNAIKVYKKLYINRERKQ